MRLSTWIFALGVVLATHSAVAQYGAQPLPNPAPQIPMRDGYSNNNPMNYPPPPQVQQRPPMNPNVYAPQQQGRGFINLNNGRICQQQGNVVACY